MSFLMAKANFSRKVFCENPTLLCLFLKRKLRENIKTNIFGELYLEAVMKLVIGNQNQQNSPLYLSLHFYLIEKPSL